MPVYYDEKMKTYYFVCRVKQPDGTTKQVKRRGFKTKKEAKLAEAKMMTSVEVSNEITFGEMCEKYVEWYEKRRKYGSILVTNALLKNQILPEFGKMKLNKILPKHIMDYQNKMIGKYAPDTLKKIHSLISAIFNFSIKFYSHTTNPARIAGNFEIESKKRCNYWTYEEFNQFINVVDDLMYKAFFNTLYFSGCRKGELQALTWGDVDFKKNEININKTEYKGQINSPKTKSSIRIILLPSFVMGILKELKNEVELKDKVKDSFVLFGLGRKSVSSATLDNRLKKYVDLSGVKKIVLHEFRHSHASYLINKGVGPNLIAKRLGHSDVAVTLNTYSHMYPSTESEIVDLMEADFKKL